MSVEDAVDRDFAEHGDIYDVNHLPFSGIKGLGDKVFAFAMTLLVYDIAIPDVPDSGLAEALVAQTPQFIAFAISFAVVVNVWWQHHKLTNLFRHMDPVMVALYFTLLGGVVLVPFASGLIGRAPSSQAAVLPFIGLFMVINLLCVLLVVRAHGVDAWKEPVTVVLTTG